MAAANNTFNAALASKRKEKDIAKLLMSDYKVIRSEENPNDFLVEFDGPKDSFYQGGKWLVHVILPESYPFKSPSIGFSNRIFHPNVDEMSGSVCLDVINQTWSPMFDLINIFDVFLPQLLMYPNPTDPLNPEAAALMLKDPKKYEARIKEGVLKYASNNASPSTMDVEKNKSKATEDMELEKQNFDDDKISFGDVSELSETSDITLVE